MYQLETEVKDSHSNALGMKEAIKTLKGESLLWVNRWHELKLKKDKYNSIKIYLAIANESLLKQGEHQKMKIMKL